MLCIVSYSHFRDLVKKGSVPEGLNPHMCLMVDAATLTSFPESKANSVLAVDVGYSPNSPRNPPGYKGYFPVAVESLLPRLYPVLASQYLSPVRAWGYANPIFDKVE